ncbi:cytoplasmic dynein 2 intermediate chain 1 isoform X1 [Neodiprion virginianus]|uniref:cytoplasmic dynein 2 intermediate chain 1 isoform X1 n=1 Tax=Neodiprion virginianus TaxID=2961670 RepID=UPI001EE74BE3|nr:cytoplasmic dynein 2 intermediate chain 1 isoform X1 [Neodiprion virginianus]
MSSKGAIKKTAGSSTVLKTKNRQAGDASSDVLASPNSKDSKLTKLRDSKIQKTPQNSINKLVSSRISSMDKPVGSQTKSIRQNGPGSTSISNTAASSPRTGAQLTSRTTTSGAKLVRQKIEVEKRLKNVPPAERNKSKEKASKSYSEKRGSSSIYLPKTIRSSNAATTRTSSQVIASKTSSVSTRDKQREGKSESPYKSAENKPRRTSRERKKSRTLSPSEIKMLHQAMKTDKAANDSLSKKDNNLVKSHGEQNRTATNDNTDDYEYEDDFEDYESDFQECTDSEVSNVSEEQEISESPEPEPIEMQREEQIKTINSADGRRSEEEHMLDSGHYELTEARKRAARIESMSMNQSKAPPLPELRQPINKSYRQEKTPENKSLPPSSTDEGFEDGRSGDFAKSPPVSQISFIDFQKPKDEKVQKKLLSKSKRGEELLNMIKLDNVEWSLIEYTPIAYEDFIMNYGRLNTQQISVQTNEDNPETETQTESIEFINKWTQHPITCRRNLNNSEDVKLFKLEQIGVGEDTDCDETNTPIVPTYDILQLNEFLSKAGKVVLSLLEEKKVGGNVLRSNSHELPFSEGFIKLAVDSVSFLVDRTVSLLHYSETLNKMLLSIHVLNSEGIETSNKEDYLTDCCIGCVWSTSEPSRPVKLFYSSCSITACCFHSTNYNVVFAGLEDGSINLWDLREDAMWHQKVTDKVNEVDWVLRSPTYTTADSVSDNYHSSEIVAIRVVSYIEKDTSNASNNRLAPIQICTLDEEGELIVWSVLYTMGIRTDDLGLAHWGDIRLQKTQQIAINTRRDKLEKIYTGYFDMHVDSVDTNNLFLATNTNSILHATCIGNKVAPNIYRGNEIEFCGGTRCIEGCPFKRSYFLVGCDDGTIRLHSLKIERALLQLIDDECKNPVKSVQWSKSKPFTIFVLDSASKIHIWNLSNSDIYPMYTISTKKWGYVTSMQLSPCKTDHDLINQYLALGTDNGRIEIHKLKKDFCYSQRNESDQELETFSRYVDIL